MKRNEFAFEYIENQTSETGQPLEHPRETWWKRFLCLYKVQVQNTNAGQGAFSYKIMNLPHNTLTERLSWCWPGAGTSVTTIHSACLLEVHNLLDSDG